MRAEGSSILQTLASFLLSLHHDESGVNGDSEGELESEEEPIALESPTLKGEKMKSHVVLLCRILDDVGIQCCTCTDTDKNTVRARVEQEGLSFLTITLPTFGKDFEKSLDQGFVDSSLFLSFKKRKSLPAFLQGLTSQVFDMESGVLLDDPSIDAIRCVRQVCYLFKALKHPCSDARMSAAFDAFVETDNQVMQLMMQLKRDDFRDYRRIKNTLFGDVLSSLDRQVWLGTLIPRHGPGATAERRRGNAKFDLRLWTERLEQQFTACDFLFPSPSHYLEHMDDVTWLTPEQEIPVRVIAVPKTLKTPRIIAIEPTYQQYVQQAFREILYDEIESDDYARHFVGFTDQEPNRTMACQGSRTGGLATLDLSEASDRVSIQHVSELFDEYPYLRAAVMSCRSQKADVPGHGVIPLAKFASMGSALTFPIEAMVFATLIFLGIEREKGTPVTRELLREYKGKVRVYGDDLVVPVDCAVSVARTLEDFGLRVNVNKSFWTGKFRESCGADYYDGVDVSYVKSTRDLPQSRKHVPELHSAVELRNHLNFRGYWRTVEYLDHLIGGIIPFPKVLPTSPLLGRHELDLSFDIQRVDSRLQRPLVKGVVNRTVIPISPISGTGALQKWFLKRGEQPYEEGHLERAGRPQAVDIKLRWMPPY